MTVIDTLIVNVFYLLLELRRDSWSRVSVKLIKLLLLFIRVLMQFLRSHYLVFLAELFRPPHESLFILKNVLILQIDNPAIVKSLAYHCMVHGILLLLHLVPEHSCAILIGKLLTVCLDLTHHKFVPLLQLILDICSRVTGDLSNGIRGCKS